MTYHPTKFALISFAMLLVVSGCRHQAKPIAQVIATYDWSAWASQDPALRTEIGPRVESMFFSTATSDPTGGVAIESQIINDRQYRAVVVFKGDARLADIGSHGEPGQMALRVACIVPIRIVITNGAEARLVPQRHAGAAGVQVTRMGSHASIELPPGIYDFRLSL
ncbi:MAG: hypothetical protein AB7U73_19435 [Pirellulales bacterium]